MATALAGRNDEVGWIEACGAGERARSVRVLAAPGTGAVTLPVPVGLGVGDGVRQANGSDCMQIAEGQA